MKYKTFLVLMVFSPVLAVAQGNRPVDSLARSTLGELIDSWNLGIDSVSDAVDIKTFNRFKSLFDLNATIEDDLNAVYENKNEKSGIYRIDKRNKAFDDYAHDVALQIKSILIDTPVIISASTSNANNIVFTIARRVHFQKARKYVLPDTMLSALVKSRMIEFHDKSDALRMMNNLNAIWSKNEDSSYKFFLEDTLQINMALDRDTVKVLSIKSFLTGLVCTNDSDGDAILDSEDIAKQAFGDFTAEGRPDYDLDGVADVNDKCSNTYGNSTNYGCPNSYFISKNEFGVSLGLQLNAVKLNLPELNQLGYTDPVGSDAIDVLQSKKGTLKSPSPVAAIHAGGNYTYYFGRKKKQLGVSVGINFSGFAADYDLTSPIVYTYKASDGINLYRRQITFNKLNESINYKLFNIPVLFSYRLHLGKTEQNILNVKIGPSFMIFSNSSSYNTTIDVGGLYQVDTIRKNSITYYDYFDRGSTYNVFFTSDSLNARPGGAGASAVFGQLSSRNYDFTENKNYTGRQNLRRFNIAANLVIDFLHTISQGVCVKAGVNLIYAPWLKRENKFKPLDKTSDEYQSVYSSNARSLFAALGINLGFVYNF